VPIWAGRARYDSWIKSFLYLHCLDLADSRRFYSTLLGLGEIFFSDEDGTVGYLVGTLQITVARHPEAKPIEGWSAQLGWAGGDTAMPSLGLELDPEDFRRAIRSLAAAGVTVRFSEPQWLGYWSYPVRDPMGHTVEISTPDRDSWPP
jgi:catechol 2,3-dioxygenase-like lactoylglutathione lyase family enzyme